MTRSQMSSSDGADALAIVDPRGIRCRIVSLTAAATSDVSFLADASVPNARVTATNAGRLGDPAPLRCVRGHNAPFRTNYITVIRGDGDSVMWEWRCSSPPALARAKWSRSRLPPGEKNRHFVLDPVVFLPAECRHFGGHGFLY